MTEKYKNLASSTLNGAITNVATSLVVTSAASFPTSGNFRIVIDNEILKVTAVAGTTFTVTRAQEGTTATAHASAAPVTHVLTSGAIDAIRDDDIYSGIISGRPGPGVPGRLAVFTDSSYLQRDNGASWDTFGPLIRMYPPNIGDFSFVNQGGATAVNSGGAIWLTDPLNAGLSVRLYLKNIPTAPYTIDCCLDNTLFEVMNAYGICWYESSSGKFVGFFYQPQLYAATVNYVLLYLGKWTNTGSFLTPYGSPVPVVQMFDWLRFGDDGTNRFAGFSPDGIDFDIIATAARTDYITPDKVGIMFYSQNAAHPMSVKILSWLEH